MPLDLQNDSGSGGGRDTMQVTPSPPPHPLYPWLEFTLVLCCGACRSVLICTLESLLQPGTGPWYGPWPTSLREHIPNTGTDRQPDPKNCNTSSYIEVLQGHGPQPPTLMLYRLDDEHIRFALTWQNILTWPFLNFPWPSILSILHLWRFAENIGKCRLSSGGKEHTKLQFGRKIGKIP